MEQNQSSNNKPTTQYCMLTLSGKFLSFDKKITVDFGKNENLLKKYSNEVAQQTLRVTQLSTIVDAMNYMTEIGWELVHLMPFETNNDGGTYDDYRYLMKRVS